MEDEQPVEKYLIAMLLLRLILPYPLVHIQVTSLKTDKSVIVRVNDRGPNQKIHPNRILDLSLAAAEAIGLKAQGVGQVKVDVLEGVPPEY